MMKIFLTKSQQRQCVEETQRVIRKARALFSLSLPDIDIHFDLRGSTSGMYVVQGKRRWIRYNPIIFAKYFAESLQQTIPHEVAHYICDCRFGMKAIRPHGREWQQTMLRLGVQPQTRSNYELSELPLRRQQRYSYRCGCNQHQISCTRHNKIVRDQAQYHCRYCGEMLVYIGE